MYHCETLGLFEMRVCNPETVAGDIAYNDRAAARAAAARRAALADLDARVAAARVAAIV